MRLKDYIEANHDKSVKGFADTHGFNRASVYRWIKDEALWFEGNVYINTTKRP